MATRRCWWRTASVRPAPPPPPRPASKLSQPDAIVSTGFCGALSPGLGIADLVTANRIVTGGQIYDAHPLKGPLCGPIRSISLRRTYGPREARTGFRRRNCGRNGSCGSGCGSLAPFDSVLLYSCCNRPCRRKFGERLQQGPAFRRPFRYNEYLKGSLASPRHPLAGINPAAETVRPRRAGIRGFLCRQPILRSPYR